VDGGEQRDRYRRSQEEISARNLLTPNAQLFISLLLQKQPIIMFSSVPLNQRYDQLSKRTPRAQSMADTACQGRRPAVQLGHWAGTTPRTAQQGLLPYSILPACGRPLSDCFPHTCRLVVCVNRSWSPPTATRQNNSKILFHCFLAAPPVSRDRVMHQYFRSFLRLGFIASWRRNGYVSGVGGRLSGVGGW